MVSIHSLPLALSYGKACYRMVQAEEYFLDSCKDAEEAVDKPRSEWNGKDYGEWAQNFWDLLPDDGSIRRGPFFLLCDLAEWWCFGDEAGEDYTPE